MDIPNDGLLLRNPLRIMNHGNTKTMLDDSFGVIVARAGTGKTALIVQLAIDTIIKNTNVLHVSFTEPVDKVSTWYNEVLNNLGKLHDLDHIEKLWELIQSRRFIMTFKIENFTVSTFEKRLKDLMKQRLFKPDVVIIDGLPFDHSTTISSIENLKTFSQRQHLHIWFTAMTHRYDELTDAGLPMQLAIFDQMFDDILQLKPKDKKVYIESFKGLLKDNENIQYFLDPATMLIQSI